MSLLLFRTAVVLALSSMLASCGGGSQATTVPAQPVIPAPVQSLTLGGDLDRVTLGGAPVALSAIPTVATTVTWTLAEGPGTLSAGSGTNISYTPPACCLLFGLNTHITIAVQADNITRYIGFILYPQPGNPNLSLLTGSVPEARIVQPHWLSSNAAGTLFVLAAQGATYSIDINGQVSDMLPNNQYGSDAPAAQLLYGPGGIYINYVRPPQQINGRQVGGAIIELRSTMDYYVTRTVIAGASLAVGNTEPRVDGPGKVATFYKADLLGFDTAANLYVEDNLNGAPLYRKITQAGEVSTVAALPPNLSTAPDTMDAGQGRNRYVYDSAAGLVYRISPSTGNSVVAGVAGQDIIRLGNLPGSLQRSSFPLYDGQLIPLTPLSLDTYALISGTTLLKLVVPPVPNGN